MTGTTVPEQAAPDAGRELPSRAAAPGCQVCRSIVVTDWNEVPVSSTILARRWSCSLNLLAGGAVGLTCGS